MARAIDADRLKDAIYTDFWEHFTQCHDSDQTALIDMVMYDIDEMPTLTPPPASRDLISRSALLMGETEPEITTGSDSELAEHMEWDRWMDKIKRAPAVDKEEEP